MIFIKFTVESWMFILKIKREFASCRISAVKSQILGFEIVYFAFLRKAISLKKSWCWWVNMALFRALKMISDNSMILLRVGQDQPQIFVRLIHSRGSTLRGNLVHWRILTHNTVSIPSTPIIFPSDTPGKKCPPTLLIGWRFMKPPIV